MIVHVDPNPGYTAHVKNDETVHANVNWHSPGQPDPNVEPLSVTNNGTYTAPQGKAYSPVTVNVPHIKKKELSVNSNGTYHAPSGEAYDPVVVNVPHKTAETLNVSENGTYNAPSGKAYDPVVVNVPQPTAQSLSVTQNGTYTAPSGVVYSQVTVLVPQYALPPAYQEVEYLETTDYQCIYILMYAGSIVTIDVSINALQENPSCFAGVYASNSSYSRFGFYNTDKIKLIQKYSSSQSETVEELASGVVANTRYRVVGVTSIYNPQYNIGCYRAGYYPFAGRIYRVEIDSLRDKDHVLVPVYRKYDNKPGFFDLTYGGFYENQYGFTDFIVGPDV